MLTWWVTEAVPIAVTALLPMVMLPTLGYMPYRTAMQQGMREIAFEALAAYNTGIGLPSLRSRE